MKVFHCDHCSQLLFFENTTCVNCKNRLAFLPDLGVVGSLNDAGNGEWTSPIPRAEGKMWRLCWNYSEHDICNWAVPSTDPHPLCRSCRVTRVMPDLTRPGQKAAWFKLEAAKRRLAYSLLTLGLPILTKDDDVEGGLAFELKADPLDPNEPGVLTGHANGVITINTAEADDAERERRRVNLHEPYRTLLGHFRHEIGHFYWDRLIRDDPERLTAFRELFGDEQQDYAQALKTHYENGPAIDWPERHVTAYASVHPWEDWAETWAHYLHMADTLETASRCGVRLNPPRDDEPTLTTVAAPRGGHADPFDPLIMSWFPLTYLMNNLNRGLGLADAYPFVLPMPAVAKLRFIHELIDSVGVTPIAKASRPQAASTDSGSVITRAMRWLARGFPADGPGT